MTPEQIDAFCQEPIVGVLSVSRPDRGPIAVPVWFEYTDGAFWLTTAPSSDHGALITDTGRATITVRSETYGVDEAVQRYVMAEGPMTFTDDPTEPLVLRLRSRYYAGPRVGEWVNRAVHAEREKVAVLRPEHLTGFDWTERL